MLVFQADGLVISGAFPNHGISRSVQTQFEDMRCLRALADNPSRQCGRQLSVNKEIQDGCSTARSACLSRVGKSRLDVIEF